MSAWLTMQEANVLGAVAGGVFGVLGGGVTGPLIGWLAPQGRAKGLVLGLQLFWIAVGLAMLLTGVTAGLIGQPGYVIKPFVLVGLIATVVMGGLLPVTLARYRQADRRRLEAEELRRG
ncbi:MAG: hypothetical protein IT436_10945 [Phycisphaerales bacterium]|nr:hypothetical protein [Phycisphaerales bacterium]